MSPVSTDIPVLIDRFPRVSGDEPGNEVPSADQPQFSPRERG